MAQSLESIKGGGGSIKLGTTGTIGSLMTRELDHISSTPHKHSSSRNKPRTLPVSVACGTSTTTTTTPKRLQPRKPSDEASSSGGGSGNSANHRIPRKAQKTKSSGRNSTHRIPILAGSDNFPVDRTPARKNDKKIPNIVEVVDVKCGNAEKAWATPIASRLKKLGFSKLSESII